MSINDLSYFRAIPMTSFNTASLTGTYAALNGTGFEHDIKLLVIYNGGSNGVTISYDNVDDHHFFPSESTFTFDIQTNHLTNSSYGSGIKVGRKGQIIYGKGTAGSGNFYIMGYY